MLKELTDKQRAAMAVHTQAWIDHALAPRPAHRAIAERGINAHYRISNLPLPKAIVWTTSPLAACIAGPIAAQLVENTRGSGEGHAAVGSTVYDAIFSAVGSAIGGTIGSAINNAIDNAVYDAVGGAVGSAVNDAVDSAVYAAVGSAVNNAVCDAVGSAADGAVRGAVNNAVGDAVGSAVGSAVRSAVNNAVGSAVGSAVRSAVNNAVGDAVGSAVGSAVRSAVYSAVYSAVDSAVGDAVDSAVYSAVRSAVYSAVHDAVKSSWHKYLGGHLWPAYPAAYGTFFRDVCGVNPAPEALQAAEDVTECGWWWPHEDFVIVCDRPVVLCRDAKGRLHSETGPAIAWADGWSVYAWHGTAVPAAWVVNKEAVRSEDVLNASNAELVQAGCALLGEEYLGANLLYWTVIKDINATSQE